MPAPFNFYGGTFPGGGTATEITSSNLLSPFSYEGGTFPGTSGTCINGGSLGGNGNLGTIVVSYSPATESLNDYETLVINYFDGLNQQSTSKFLTGSSVAGLISKLFN